MKRVWLVVALLALQTAPGWAQPQAPPAAPVIALPSGQESDDDAAVSEAANAARIGGFPALSQHVPQLQAVLAHAPPSLALIDERPDEVVYRGRDLAGYLGAVAVLQSRWKANGEAGKKIVWTPSPYPIAAFMLGAYHNELHEWDSALPVLQQGLALTPADPMLVTETGITLGSLHRYADALALYDRALAADPEPAKPDKARILRARGYALTELNRLDEAEQAYRDSLALDPDHEGAKHELAYIAALKAGAAPQPGQEITGDKARNGVPGRP